MIDCKPVNRNRLSLLVLIFLISPAFAAENVPKLQTNQAYVEQLLSPRDVRIDDAPSVLSYVLNSLRDEVLVYPTENYYYFSFFKSGIKFSGNLRLDASDRDAGIIHFAYFRENSEWSGRTKSTIKIFGPKEGVKVERINPLSYRVTFRNRSVLFKLNDLSDLQPPPGTLTAGEEYIGPVFDESGLQFFLIYKTAIKKFLYVLNRINQIPDVLVPDKTHPRIDVAQRTGFVFYRDHLKDRLILIGVYGRNVVLNNYFDGPFDQLPDNFIKGDRLKAALIDQRPERAGTIDRFGKMLGGNNRISISPYLNYLSLDELYGFDQCAQKYKAVLEKYYTCFDAANLGIE